MVFLLATLMAHSKAMQKWLATNSPQCYRALQNGAPIDENMKRAMNEFGPELQNIRLNHFRIDRISGGDNDRHKTERVRVNNEPENQRDVYGSRIYK